MPYTKDLIKNLEMNLERDTKASKEEAQEALRNYLDNLNNILSESQKRMEESTASTHIKVKRMFWLTNVSWLLLAIALIFAQFISKPLREAQLQKIIENQQNISQLEKSLKEAEIAGIEIVEEERVHYIVIPANREIELQGETEDGRRVWKVIGRR